MGQVLFRLRDVLAGAGGQHAARRQAPDPRGGLVSVVQVLRLASGAGGGVVQRESAAAGAPVAAGGSVVVDAGGSVVVVQPVVSGGMCPRSSG